MKKIFLILSSLIFGILILSGCLEVEKSHFTLKYSQSKGQGYFKQVFSNIGDSDSKKQNQKASMEEKKGLEEMVEHLKTILSGMGAKNVKGEVKASGLKNSFNAFLSGKFFSFGQLPFFSSVKISFEDKDEKIEEKSFGRLDQVIEFNIKSSDLIATGKKNTFVFESTDKNATIIEAKPQGTIGKNKKTVTWELESDSKEIKPYRVQIKGKRFKNL